MKEEVLNIEGIDITFFSSTKAKSLNITLQPFSGVRVSVPESISLDKAKKAVKERMSWIKTNLSKMQKAEDKFTVFTEDTEFKTKEHQLEITHSDVKEPKSIVRDGLIKVFVPYGIDTSTNSIQLIVREGIEKAWRKEAKDYLPKRVKRLAKKHDFQYNKVTVRNTTTRWGSCSIENNLNLSLHLMRLPNYLIDYVILHELTHTKIKNHSRDFWQLLDSVTGSAKKLDKEVRECRIQIY